MNDYWTPIKEMGLKKALITIAGAIVLAVAIAASSTWIVANYF